MLPVAHISVRSAFSLKEGAILPEVIPHVAKATGMNTVAMTDRDEEAAAAGERFTLTALAKYERGSDSLPNFLAVADLESPTSNRRPRIAGLGWQITSQGSPLLVRRLKDTGG